MHEIVYRRLAFDQLNEAIERLEATVSALERQGIKPHIVAEYRDSLDQARAERDRRAGV